MTTPNGIFLLRWGGIDASQEYYFIGPEGVAQGDFQRICDGLMRQAAFNAVEDAEDAERGFIGWDKLVERLSCLLEAEGFQRFEPTTVCYSGPQIILGEFNRGENLDGAARERVENHNKRVMARMAQRFE